MGPLRKLESLNIHCGVWTWLALYKTLIKKRTLKMCAKCTCKYHGSFS